jgi:hypothetical protein
MTPSGGSPNFMQPTSIRPGTTEPSCPDAFTAFAGRCMDGYLVRHCGNGWTVGMCPTGSSCMENEGRCSQPVGVATGCDPAIDPATGQYCGCPNLPGCSEEANSCPMGGTCLTTGAGENCPAAMLSECPQGQHWEQVGGACTTNGCPGACMQCKPDTISCNPPPCVAPPPGYHYVNIPVDQNGCQTGCGTLERDAGEPTPPVASACGNGTCDTGEDQYSCPTDCRPTAAPICEDSDNMNPMTRGMIRQSGYETTKDVCRPGLTTHVQEYFCSETGVMNSLVECPAGTKCTGGPTDGTCAPIAGYTPTTPETCSDTDGGFQPNTAGSAADASTVKADTCNTDPRHQDYVWEAYCTSQGKVKQVSVICDAGKICRNGACM